MQLLFEGSPEEVAALLHEFLRQRELELERGRPKGRSPIHVSEDGLTAWQQIGRDGEIVQVDLQDMHLLVQHRWYINRCRNRSYARTAPKRRNGRISNPGGYLHNMIAKPEPGKLTDHINGDPLDNRRRNLRVVNFQQNAWNQRSVYGALPYKGVHHSGKGLFSAAIRVGGLKKHLGTFQTPEEAAHAYDVAATFYYGEYAATNEDLGLRKPERKRRH